MEIRPDAAQRYQELAQEILNEIRSFPPPTPTSANVRNDIHVSHVFTPDQILSMPEVSFLQDEFGIQCGVVWNSQGLIVGWQGSAFEKIRQLAQRMAASGPIKNLVSEDFAVNATCTWMRQTLERQRTDSLPAYFVQEVLKATREQELWFPVFRTYSRTEFRIGEVTFRTISKALLDEWQARAPTSQKEEAAALIDRYRAKFQGSVAACVRVQAERIRASELARSAATNALSLLSFLSPANQSSKLTNFGVLLGSEVLGSITELEIVDDCIQSIQQTVNDKRRGDWFIQAIPADQTWILPALHDLASSRSTELRQAVYDALILHSRHAQARELSDKLIFALSALESMFLRDANEPIQKNLGERMAFLIGKSVDERKAVVKNVAEVYKIRSAFVHHGASPRHQDALDEFLSNAWRTFAELLRLRDSYKSKAALLGFLEDRKMS